MMTTLGPAACAVAKPAKHTTAIGNNTSRNRATNFIGGDGSGGDRAGVRRAIIVARQQQKSTPAAPARPGCQKIRRSSPNVRLLPHAGLLKAWLREAWLREARSTGN